mgnify:CR=1 FL=1
MRKIINFIVGAFISALFCRIFLNSLFTNDGLGKVICAIFSIIGGIVGILRAAHIDEEILEDTEKSTNLLDIHMQNCINMAIKTRNDTRYKLYHDGLEEAISLTITVLTTTKFIELYLNSLKNESGLNDVFSFVEQKYKTIFLSEEKNAVDEQMKADFENAKKQLFDKTKIKITEMIKSESDIYGNQRRCLNFIMIVPLIYLLEYISNDKEYHKTLNALYEYHINNRSIFSYIQPLEHGNFNLNNVQECDIEKIQSELQKQESHIIDNKSGYFEGVRNNLNSSLLYKLGLCLWYYAEIKPFNVSYFDKAVSNCNNYREFKGNALECVLADVYVKNKLGGEVLVMQCINDIMKEAEIKNPIYARALCSFLAWIECYQVELEVLKKAVESKIPLTSDMLERLEFLAKGGTKNQIKIYDVTPSNSSEFLFDSSTENIDANGLDLLFDTLKRRRKKLNYSLVLKKWTKILPLPKGKIFSIDSLNMEFNELVEDFNNEISYSTINAQAVDLSNLFYRDCALFRFTTERSKGMSILFNVEKFGRNLNLTILTMFTPEKNVDEIGMSKYAKSILINSYADSFQETILQALDYSLKEKVEIYEKDTENKSHTLFE